VVADLVLVERGVLMKERRYVHGTDKLAICVTELQRRQWDLDKREEEKDRKSLAAKTERKQKCQSH